MRVEKAGQYVFRFAAHRGCRLSVDDPLPFEGPAVTPRRNGQTNTGECAEAGPPTAPSRAAGPGPATRDAGPVRGIVPDAEQAREAGTILGAALNGDAAKVAAFLDQGVNVNATNRNGSAALHMAART